MPWVPGDPDQDVAVSRHQAIHVDVLAESSLRRGAHATDQVWPCRYRRCQDERCRRAPVARGRKGHTINFAALVSGKLIGEHRHVGLPEKTGDCTGRVTRPRQAASEAFHGVGFRKAAFYADITLRTVRARCRPPAPDHEGRRGKSDRGSARACDRSLFRRKADGWLARGGLCHGGRGPAAREL